MKDSEFIELLNLYLDHEISAADAARLEAEVLGNPARRQTYQEYCRMQKACKMLAKEFQTEAVPDADRKVVAFELERPARRTGSVYFAGAMVAGAACLAVIFGLRDRAPSTVTATNPVAATAPAPAKETSVMIAATTLAADRDIPRTVTVPAVNEEPQARVVNALTLTGSKPATQKSLLATDVPSQFQWISTTQLAPVQRVPLDQFRFTNQSGLRAENRLSPRAGNAVEMNALRYQK